jgi:hypothetical protein
MKNISNKTMVDNAIELNKTIADDLLLQISDSTKIN